MRIGYVGRTVKQGGPQVLEDGIKIFLLPAVHLFEKFHLLGLRTRCIGQPDIDMGLAPQERGVFLTFWHTTQRGKPSASSHSPGPIGRAMSPSPGAATPVPSRCILPPLRPRSRHPTMTSSMAALHSWSSEAMTVRSKMIQVRRVRIHRHGCDQSSRMTTRVLGIVCGVRSGLRRDTKDGEGLVKR